MHHIPIMMVIARGESERLLDRLRRREDGVSTLEMVVIALGLLAIAGVLVAALTAAVTSRTEQLK